MTFKHGYPRSPGSGRGRESGTRATRALRDAILEALAAEGGVEYLRKLAREEARVFGSLLGRILPREAEKSDDDGVPTVILRSYVGSLSDIESERYEEIRKDGMIYMVPKDPRRRQVESGPEDGE